MDFDTTKYTIDGKAYGIPTVVLDQIVRQQEEIQALRTQLDQQERESDE